MARQAALVAVRPLVVRQAAQLVARLLAASVVVRLAALVAVPEWAAQRVVVIALR